MKRKSLKKQTAKQYLARSSEITHVVCHLNIIPELWVTLYIPLLIHSKGYNNDVCGAVMMSCELSFSLEPPMIMRHILWDFSFTLQLTVECIMRQ